MTSDILSLHVLRSLEIVISVAETDESISFALRRALVPNHARFLHTGVFGKSFEQGVVRDFACKIANEQPEVRRIPFEE